MHLRRFAVLLALDIGLVTLFTGNICSAATRARFRAETMLNDPVVRIAAGDLHTCQVNEDGRVRCWGFNGKGQLGNGSTSTGPTFFPVLVSGLAGAVALAAGSSHTCALLADGTARCWGANESGQLGDGTVTDRLTPVAVIGLTGAVAIAAGSGHNCALLANGTLRCWGGNQAGQLGDGTTTNRLTAALPVSGLGNAVAIEAGTDHTCALVAFGRVLCWGRNSSGQLGDGNTSRSLTPVTAIGLTDAVAITGGSGHTCALLADGLGECWGQNGIGELGDGTTTERHFPVLVTGLSSAVAVVGGLNHTCAALADGSAKCWGRNLFGELGHFTPGTAFSTSPVVVDGGGGSFTARDIAAGRNHTCAVRANSTVACWGNNDSGQIGDGTIGANRLSPFTIPNLTGVVAIAAGEAHTCALVAALGRVLCWGLNSSGQLGDGTTSSRPTPVAAVGLTNAVAIAAGGTLGSSHTCALLADGTVRCWGANGSGQLGTGNTVPSSIPVVVPGLTNAVSIALGETHTCALVAVGVPFCWGFNGSGRLGDGTLTTHFVPTLVSLDRTVAIAAGNTHSCALRADGTAWCWGGNLLGQLGINSTVSQFAPTLVVNTNLANAVAIAGGFGHSCATVAGGGARCWGDNSAGQLGNATTSPSLTPVVVGSFLNCLGCTFFRPLGGTVTITTGRRHSCALIVNGGVSCWGENTSGQVGNGTTSNQLTPFSVPSFTLNIDPAVTLQTNGRVTTVTVVATCEAGQWLHAEVTLTQGTVSGRGIATGECTGGLTRYPAIVPAQGRDPFLAGPAVVTAEATIRDGSAVETQAWTRQVTIAGAP